MTSPFCQDSDHYLCTFMYRDYRSIKNFSLRYMILTDLRKVVDNSVNRACILRELLYTFLHASLCAVCNRDARMRKRENENRRFLEICGMNALRLFFLSWKLRGIRFLFSLVSSSTTSSLFLFFLPYF